MTILTNLAAPIARTSLADSVYQHILEAILAGGLPGGTELNEVALAAEVGVSRTPVHEALRRLAADGLVVQLANRRACVAQFGRQDILEIYEMRKILECATVERAARQLPEDQLAELRAEAEDLHAARDGRAWSNRALDFDIRFHALLAAAAGNERLRGEITKYRHLVRALCRMSGPANLRAALAEHRRILDALEARDPATARRAMAVHIDARLQAVLATFDGQQAAC